MTRREWIFDVLNSILNLSLEYTEAFMRNVSHVSLPNDLRERVHQRIFGRHKVTRLSAIKHLYSLEYKFSWIV